MNIELVNLVIGVAVLLITVEFSLDELNRIVNRRITSWETSIYRALSALAKANKTYQTISDEIEKNEAKEINKQWKYVDEVRKDFRNYEEKEWIVDIRFYVPFLLTIEAGHVALQYFGWSSWYDQNLTGLNNIFILVIIGLILILSSFMIAYKKFVDGLNKKKFDGKTISEFEAHNSRIIRKYEFGML